MAKQYHLIYEFLGEPRNILYDTLFEFQAALEKAMDNPNVPDSTIDFNTTDKVVPVRKRTKDKTRANGLKYKPDFAPKKE